MLTNYVEIHPMGTITHQKGLTNDNLPQVSTRQDYMQLTRTPNIPSPWQHVGENNTEANIACVMVHPGMPLSPLEVFLYLLEWCHLPFVTPSR